MHLLVLSCPAHQSYTALFQLPGTHSSHSGHVLMSTAFWTGRGGSCKLARCFTSESCLQSRLCAYVRVDVRGFSSPGAGVTDSRESPSVSAGNGTPVFCKNTMYTSLLSHVTRLCPFIFFAATFQQSLLWINSLIRCDLWHRLLGSRCPSVAKL